MKKLTINILVILLVIALTAGATYAYFSAANDEKATVTAAKIAIDETWNFPLVVENLLPGEEKYQDVSIRNTGNREADFFFQMIGTDEPGDTPGLPNFCIPNQVVDIAIYDLNTSAWLYSWRTICDLYPGQTGSVILKLGDDVPAGAWKDLRIYLRLAATAGNEYQSMVNTDTVHLIAVQYNGPAPVADQQGFPAMMSWPLEDDGTDDDPNYP